MEKVVCREAGFLLHLVFVQQHSGVLDEPAEDWRLRGQLLTNSVLELSQESPDVVFHILNGAFSAPVAL